MKYEIFGGFEIPRKPNKKSVVDARDLYILWDDVNAKRPGLSSAVGWYVGKTCRQGFSKECFTSHKRVYYNEVIADHHGVPLLYLVARTTPGGKLTASVPPTEAEFLESMLIGRALQRNDDLKNRTHATFLKKLHVPGLVNPQKGPKSTALRDFTSMLKA